MSLNEIEACCFNNKSSNILNVKVKTYTECGYCSDHDNQISISVPWEIYTRWLYFSNKLGDKEWAGIFTVKDNAITDFKIPKQEVSGSSVEFQEDLGGNGIVHSHHNMGAFHSGQDEKHCRNLYDYSIVLSNGKGYVASKRVKLPCGAFGYVSAKLALTDCPQNIDLSKITEKKYIQRDWWGYSQHQPALPHYGDESGRVETGELNADDSPCTKCVAHECHKCQFLTDTEEACFYCESLKCKSCDHNLGDDLLPFCAFCEYPSDCHSCEKLEKYLQNYPEDKNILQDE